MFADLFDKVNVSSVWEIKLAAIRCHATQMSSSPMMRASAERQRLFFGREYFVRAVLRHIACDFLPDTLKGYIQCPTPFKSKD